MHFASDLHIYRNGLENGKNMQPFRDSFQATNLKTKLEPKTGVLKQPDNS
jgi:hypothetical protein